MPIKSALICADCQIRGVKQLATYVFVPDENLLTGPAMGQPDYSAPHFEDRRGLCDDCFAWLSADARLSFQRVPDDIEEI